MYCRNCGKEIADNAAVCVNCGVSLNKKSDSIGFTGKMTDVDGNELA